MREFPLELVTVRLLFGTNYTKSFGKKNDATMQRLMVKQNTKTKVPSKKSKTGQVIRGKFQKTVASGKNTDAMTMKFRSWVDEFDIQAPWLLRLVSLIGILILSMLIL